jgi:hypothetical protein
VHRRSGSLDAGVRLRDANDQARGPGQSARRPGRQSPRASRPGRLRVPGDWQRKSPRTAPVGFPSSRRSLPERRSSSAHHLRRAAIRRFHRNCYLCGWALRRAPPSLGVSPMVILRAVGARRHRCYNGHLRTRPAGRFVRRLGPAGHSPCGHERGCPGTTQDQLGRVHGVAMRAEQTKHAGGGVKRGTPPGTRTQNQRIKSPLLCPLS